jgi:hypothetical protein
MSSDRVSLVEPVPRLASSSGGSGLPHATWRPQMQTFLMRRGIEERDYTEAIPQWKELVASVQSDARDLERAAIETLLGSSPATQQQAAGAQTPTRATSSVKTAAASSEAQQRARQRVAALIGRARKACAYLHAALPADLRLLVADIPQGYAFGLWSFLEKKFRNTEQDNVAALWKEFVTLAQADDEGFDEYKARVDAVVELLRHAKEQPPAGLYSTLLLWNLQPRYAGAVLALKASDRLKDPATIDWPAVVEYMAQYERNQQVLGETEI